jgi:hypothetical protein
MIDVTHAPVADEADPPAGVVGVVAAGGDGRVTADDVDVAGEDVAVRDGAVDDVGPVAVVPVEAPGPPAEGGGLGLAEHADKVSAIPRTERPRRRGRHVASRRCCGRRSRTPPP